MINRLATLLNLPRLTHVVDIGASPIDGPPPYQQLLEAGLCQVTGFDPLRTASGKDREIYRSEVVGDGAWHTLNICAYPGWTSLFAPSAAALECFNFFQANARIIGEAPVATHRLDDLGLDGVDFLKMDIQGSELAVLTHARQTLMNVVAVQTEVQFVNLYDGQPSFWEVDRELRTQGFIPHAFAALKKWPIGPLRHADDPTRAVNQLLEADIVYVRDFTRPETILSDQLKQLSLLALGCYGSWDLAGRCVALLQKRGDLSVGALDEFVALLGP
jgi:FkbM family methyltransferase